MQTHFTICTFCNGAMVGAISVSKLELAPALFYFENFKGTLT